MEMIVEPVLRAKTLQAVCRTCLQTQELFFFDDVHWEHVSLRKLLSKWIDFEQSCELKLPQQICKPCMKWIYNIDYFLTRIQKTQENLMRSYELSQYLEGIEQMKQEDTMKSNNYSQDDNVDNVSKSSDIPCNNSDCYKESEDEDIDGDVSSRLPVVQNDSCGQSNSFPEYIAPVEPPGKGTPEWYVDEISKGKSEVQALRKQFFESERIAALQKEWIEQGPNGTMTQEMVASEGNENGIYFCGTCELGFGSNEQLKLHRNVALHWTGKTYYGCTYCKKKMKTRSRLEDHLNMHKNKRPNVCDTCGKAFTAKNDLNRHIDNVHLKKRKLKCHFCYKVFSDPNKREEHEKIHDDKIYVCSSCGKMFKKFHSWFAHESLHKRKDRVKTRANADEFVNAAGEFQCSDCGLTFESKSTFEQHLVEHDRTKIVSCDICHKEFNGADRMKHHKYKVHPAQKSACHLCDFVSNYKQTLECHIARVHQDVVSTAKGKFPCQYCDKVFYNNKSHRLHLRLHSNDTKYMCQICHKICTTKRNLEIHMRVHTGERAHECAQCGKKFASKANLKYHAEMHAGEPTLVCTLCSKAFYRNRTLQKHMRQVHGEKQSAQVTKLDDRSQLITANDEEEAQESS